VTLTLSPGQDHDIKHAPELLAPSQTKSVKVVIADKGYVSRLLRQSIVRMGAVAVIPSKSNSVDPQPLDAEQYKDRNLAERFWSKVKQYRRVATRYEKKASNYLGMVQLASIMVLLQ
jgi:transposase